MRPVSADPETDRRLSVHAAAEEAPSRPGLIVPDGPRLSWRELSEAVARIEADLLDSGGAGPGPGIVEAEATPAAVVRILAMIERKVPIVPIDPRVSAPERSARLQLLRGAAGPVLHGHGGPTVGGDAPLAVLFTSGTTGAPRAVELSRRAFLASAHASAERLGWREDDRWLCVLPLAHIGGLSILTRCLTARRTIVLPARFDPDRVCRAIESERVTIASFVPTMLFRLLAAEPPWRPSTRLRAVLLGGAPASDELWDAGLARGIPLLETWGMTETCSQVATAVPGGPPRAPVPLSGWSVRSRHGRLEVRGDALFTRYVGDPADDADAPRLEADGWFRTGDLGHIDSDGSVSITGRSDEMIITGGRNVSPAEVERVLVSLPGVRRAAVVGLPDPAWGETVAAALEPDAGTFSADRSGAVPPAGPGVASPAIDRTMELARLLDSRFGAASRPRIIVWMERLPETASGKVDRAEVRRRIQETRESPEAG